MDTKNLSPAFFTSLAVLFLGALLIGLGSSFAVVLGWLLFLAGICLNVFSTLVVIQKAKGGPLPDMIARADSSTTSDAVHGGTSEAEYEAEEEADELEPEPDTEAQDVVSSVRADGAEENERIFRSNRPRVRNR